MLPVAYVSVVSVVRCILVLYLSVSLALINDTLYYSGSCIGKGQSSECDYTLQCPSAPEHFMTEPASGPPSAHPSLPTDSDESTSDSDKPPSRFPRAPSTPCRSPIPPNPAEPPRTILSPLRRELNSQPHAAAKKRRLMLMQMSSYEFTRECNMARNRVLGASLGIKKGIFGRPNFKNLKKPKKKPNDGASRLKYNNLRRSRRSTNAKPNQQSVDKPQASTAETRVTPVSSSSGSLVATPIPNNPLQCANTNDQSQSVDSVLPSDVETQTSSGPAIPFRCATPLATSVELANSPVESSQTPATQPSPKPMFTVNRTAWPKWLTEKYDHYTALEFGDKWKECLFIWAEIECAFNFHNPVSFYFPFLFRRL
jgi:hypothetical protein